MLDEENKVMSSKVPIDILLVGLVRNRSSCRNGHARTSRKFTQRHIWVESLAEYEAEALSLRQNGGVTWNLDPMIRRLRIHNRY